MHENDHVKMPVALFGKKGSRRDFLRNTAVTALACRAAESDHGLFGLVTALIGK